MARIFLTGFDIFGDCMIKNPSQSLVEKLAQQYEENIMSGCTPNYSIIGSKILKVSGALVRQWLTEELYSSSYVSSKSNQGPLIVVHIGVNLKAQKINLELCAINEATFRIPDASGWQPKEERVLSADRFRYLRKTKLPLPKIADKLKSSILQVSTDAGRYVCNFSYYLSLATTSPLTHATALFVHVPPFECVDMDEQLETLLQLFEELGGCFEEWQEEETNVTNRSIDLQCGNESKEASGGLL